MLRFYVSDNQKYWSFYVQALKYAYNSSMNRITGLAPFQLVLSSPLAKFSIREEEQRAKENVQDIRNSFIRQIDTKLGKAEDQLSKEQAR